MHFHYLHPPSDTALFKQFQSWLDPKIRLTWGEDHPGKLNCAVLIDGRPGQVLLTQNKNLKSLVVPFAGLPPETRDVCLGFPALSVYNLHHNATITAEMAVVLMLSAARFVIRYDRSFRTNDWSMRYDHQRPSILLNGKKVLLLGYGAIGKQVAKVCRALGMQVSAIKRHVEYEGVVINEVPCYSPTCLSEQLSDTQVLIVVCPLTEETRGLINEKTLLQMPKGGILVNVGRAQIVEEAALYQALITGQLAAAGLDVWYRYPGSIQDRSSTKPSDYPFWELDQVVIHRKRSIIA